MSEEKYRKVTHIIFDMDGTLVDTEKIYFEVITAIAAEYEKEFDSVIHHKLLGTVEQDAAKIAVTEMKLPITSEQFLDKLHSGANEALKSVPLMPGADKLIRHLHNNKIPIAVATSSTSQMVEDKTTNHKELFAFFDHIVCAGDDPEVKKGKPAPDIFLICASRFKDKPKPEDCLVLEDAPNGITGALAAGMQVVMIPDASVSADVYKKATLKLNSMVEFQPELFGLPAFTS